MPMFSRKSLLSLHPFPIRNPLLMNGTVDVKGRNGSTGSGSGNAFIDCTLESLSTEDLKNEVRKDLIWGCLLFRL